MAIEYEWVRYSWEMSAWSERENLVYKNPGMDHQRIREREYARTRGGPSDRIFG